MRAAPRPRRLLWRRHGAVALEGRITFISPPERRVSGGLCSPLDELKEMVVLRAAGAAHRAGIWCTAQQHQPPGRRARVLTGITVSGEGKFRPPPSTESGPAPGERNITWETFGPGMFISELFSLGWKTSKYLNVKKAQSQLSFSLLMPI